MRVLVLGLNYAPELVGIAPYTTAMAQGLASRGHEVTVIAGRPYYPHWRVADTDPTGAPALEQGVTVHRVRHYVPARPTGVRRTAHHLSFALSALAAALRVARRRRPDIVIAVAPSLAAAPVALGVARLAGAPALLHVQDFELDAAFHLQMMPFSRLVRRPVQMLERALFAGFDRITTISPAMRRRLADKGVAPHRSRVIFNGIDLSRFTPETQPVDRHAWGLAGQQILLYSGTLNAKQDLDTVIDMAWRLQARPDIGVVVCGDGPERPRLEAAARTLPNLTLLPLQPAEALPALLALADIHLLPQRAQAADLVMPSKLGAMLASGRPILATARPGSAIATALAGCGEMVDHGDAEAMAAAAVRLLADPERRAALGRMARLRAAQGWDLTAMIDAFEAECLDLVRTRASRPAPGRPEPEPATLERVG